MVIIRPLNPAIEAMFAGNLISEVEVVSNEVNLSPPNSRFLFTQAVL
jgi:hypothetical protein